MSKIVVKPPVIIHTPSITRWKIQRYYLVQELEKLNIHSILEEENYCLFEWLCYTNLEGWGKILYDLTFSSSLYKPGVFMCSNYALKAQVECAERHGLKSLLYTIGKHNDKGYAFNIICYGSSIGLEGFLLWEPNDGFPFSGSVFEIGEYGYKPELVLI